MTDSIPPNRLISSVRAVVLFQGTIVTLRNADGIHFLPGGRIEPGETIEAALRREVLEETGLSLIDPKVIGFLHFRHLTPKPKDYGYPYPDMIHLVYSAQGEGALGANDPTGYEFEVFRTTIDEARSLQGNDYAYPFVEAIGA